jgi:peptidoglycan/LPS O-acetylase OafA/YrhL
MACAENTFTKKQHMQQDNRQNYLDWLRMFAIIGVLLFHSAMPFAAEESWHIKNKETSNLLLEFNFWLSRFRMPLLFFISGAVTLFILKRRSAGQFVGLRFKRLIIPLIFGMLVIVPPQVYMERITQGFNGSFLDFYPSVFEGKPYPEGDTSWHHLWFILYLFLYNLIVAPLFAWLIHGNGKKVMTRLNVLAKGKRIYLIILPGVIAYTALVLRFPQTNDLIHDWAHFIYWFFFFLAGFICITNQSLVESLQRNRRFSLTLAIATIIAINYFRWNDLNPWDTLANWENDWRTYVALSLRALTAWLWVLAIVGYGKQYINKKHRILDYVNEAIYPFYILHQTIIVIIAFYVVQTTDTIMAKYGFIVLVSFVLSVSFYHVFIRPYKVMRFLFGMPPTPKSKITKPVSSNPATPPALTGGATENVVSFQ